MRWLGSASSPIVSPASTDSLAPDPFARGGTMRTCWSLLELREVALEAQGPEAHLARIHRGQHQGGFLDEGAVGDRQRLDDAGLGGGDLDPFHGLVAGNRFSVPLDLGEHVVRDQLPSASWGAMEIQDPCGVAERHLQFRLLPGEVGPQILDLRFQIRPLEGRLGERLEPRLRRVAFGSGLLEGRLGQVDLRLQFEPLGRAEPVERRARLDLVELVDLKLDATGEHQPVFVPCQRLQFKRAGHPDRVGHLSALDLREGDPQVAPHGGGNVHPVRRLIAPGLLRRSHAF